MLALHSGETGSAPPPGGSLPSAEASSHPRTRQGFTLIEIMIALSLLSILALSTMLAIIPVGRQARLSREMNTAATALRSVLEQVQTLPFDSLPSRYLQGQVVPVAALSGGQIVINYTDPTVDPIEISIAISWNSPEMGPYSRTFTTLKTR